MARELLPCLTQILDVVEKLEGDSSLTVHTLAARFYEETGFPSEKILSDTRYRPYPDLRHALWYLYRKRGCTHHHIGDLTLGENGSRPHHATMISGIRKIERFLREYRDRRIQENVCEEG